MLFRSTQFLTDKLGLVFRNASYVSLSGNQQNCADILTTTNLTSNTDVYGVATSCQWGNDVFQRNPALVEATEGAFYENVGAQGPYVSDVVKTAVPLRNWVAVTSGYEIEHLFSRYCDTDGGRLAYYYYMLNKVFGSICTITGPPCPLLDVPGSEHVAGLIDFMKVGEAVMRRGVSTVHLGVAHAGRVRVRIYDVAGRLVRVLADREFPVGEHTLTWDGTDDDGGKAARGVYFVRSSNQQGAGRIIVLNR